MAKRSVTQIETFQACNRKWWWDRVMKQGSAGGTNVFGVILHACIERAYKGEEVFPPDWDYSFDRYTGKYTGRLSNNECAQIAMLIGKARTAGWFNAAPGFKVEHEFDVDLGDGDHLVGFIDLVEPGIITDQKSSKSARYLETAETLKDDTQLLTYAKVALPSDLPSVVVRHNQFIKEPVSIQRVEVTIERKAIEEKWAQVLEAAGQMKQLQTVTDKDQVGYNERECSNWGGCPFKSKCFPDEEY